MAHKLLSAPSSGALDKVYGTDWNKLIQALQQQDASNPLTLNVDHHVFKHSTTNAAGDLLVGNATRYVRKPRGTANQQLRTNAAGTDIEWFTPAAGTWNPTGVETITNKTIDADDNTILDIDNGNIAAAAGIAYSKLALSNGITNNDINSAAAIAQTKLAKITDTTKLPDTTRFDFSVRKTGGYNLASATSGHGVLNGFLTSVGTHSRQMSSVSGVRARWSTGTALDDQAGIRSTDVFTRRSNLIKLSAKLAIIGTPTSVTLFFGLISGTSAFLTSADPLNSLHGFGIWVNTTTNTNFRIIRNDGAGVSVTANFTTPRTADTQTTFEITCNNSTPSWTIAQEGVAETAFTTDIPGDVDMYLACFVHNRAAGAAREFDIRHLEFVGNPS